MEEKYPIETNLEELEARGINRYQAVLLAAQEARLINTRNRLEDVSPEERPTTEAVNKLFGGSISIDEM